MTIKRSVAVSLVLTYFVPTVIVGWLLFSAILENFEQVEVQVMHERVENLKRNYQRDLLQLANIARDWAQYDEPVRFLKNPRDAATLSWLLSPISYININISDVTFITAKGKILVSTRISDDQKSVYELQGSEKQILEDTIKNYLPGTLPDSQSIGTILLHDQPHEIAIVTIYPADYSGTVRGYLAMLRPIPNKYWKHLLSNDTLNATISRHTSVEKNSLEENIVQDDWLSGKFSLTDPKNSSSFLLTLTAPRDLFLQARLHWYEYLFLLVIFAAFAVSASYLLLNSTVVNRLRMLERTARDIARKRDFSARVEEGGSEEFISLSQSLNSMLQGLEDANHELEIARDQAEAANKAKISFISKVSHELRTPISTVIGNLGFLKKQTLPKESRHRLNLIEESSEGLLGVVNDILDFTEISNNQVPITKRAVDLKDLLLQLTTSEIPRWLTHKEIIFTIEIANSIPEQIVSDKERLKQIFRHLISNAIKFTSKGNVRLTITSEKANLIISVTDTGMGMDQQLLSKLNEPFTQLEETSNRKYDGLGLGLTLIKKVVVSMNGALKINSTQSVGTQIQVLLPDTVTESTTSLNTALMTIYSNEGNNRNNQTKLHVLLGNTLPLERIIIKNALEIAGHTVVCVDDGQMMLKQLKNKNNKFDLILVDSEMPGCSGFEVAQISRSQGFSAPIFIVAPSITVDAQTELQKAGCSGFLTKPVRLKELQEVLQTAKSTKPI